MKQAKYHASPLNYNYLFSWVTAVSLWPQAQSWPPTMVNVGDIVYVPGRQFNQSGLDPAWKDTDWWVARVIQVISPNSIEISYDADGSTDVFSMATLTEWLAEHDAEPEPEPEPEPTTFGCSRCKYSKKGCSDCRPRTGPRTGPPGCSRCKYSKNGCSRCRWIIDYVRFYLFACLFRIVVTLK